MNHSTEIAASLMMESAGAVQSIVHYAKQKTANMWVSTKEVMIVWDNMPLKENKVARCSIIRSNIVFSDITSMLNKKLKSGEIEMGLNTVERCVIEETEKGIPVGTEYNGRNVVAVLLREIGSQNNWTAKSFSFYADKKLNLESGDIVVVDADGAPTTGLIVNRELSAMDMSRVSKWVIGRIDMTSHLKRLEQERMLKAMSDKMESRVKNIEKNMKYIMLAAQDPEMARMYVEMQKLDPTMPNLPEGTKIAEIE